MTDAIAQIKEYIRTPEGAEWFMNAVRDAQEQIRLSEESKRLNHATHKKDERKEFEKSPELQPVKIDRNIKSLLVSRHELENVIQWTEKHPVQEKDGRYILRVTKSGDRIVLKSKLLMKGESVSSSQLVTDDPKKILSGDIIRVTTRGAHIETYTVSLTN